MVNPETNEIAIARRLLGMAARIGNSAIPEEIANEARQALFDLAEARGCDVQRKGMALAQVLIRHATLREPAFSLERAAENLRASIRMEELCTGKGEAAA